MRRTIAFILPFLLAACGTADPVSNEAANGQVADGSANAAVPGTASPEPDASATTDGTGLAALTPDGWGPLKIGMTIDEITRALGPDDDPEAVGGPDPASCDQFRPANAPRGMLVMVEEGLLTSISLIDDSPVRTDRGIGIGDERGAVTKTYGAAAIASPHKYVEKPAAYIDVWARGGSGEAFVTAPSARGIRYEIDEKNIVGAIHAGGPSIQYVEGCA